MSDDNGRKKYGPHRYPSHGYTSSCLNGCGCAAGPSSSGGPPGLDPLGGACPGNPEDGTFLGRGLDYRRVVEDRIADLQRRAREAELLLEQVSPGEIELAQTLAATQAELANARQRLAEVRRLVTAE